MVTKLLIPVVAVLALAPAAQAASVRPLERVAFPFVAKWAVAHNSDVKYGCHWRRDGLGACDVWTDATVACFRRLRIDGREVRWVGRLFCVRPD